MSVSITVLSHGSALDVFKRIECITSAMGKDKSIRYLTRNIHQELFGTLETMQKPVFISKLRESVWKIEGIFAEAKAVTWFK